jgi:hypothetical protein
MESNDNSNGEFDICDRSLLEVGERYEETEKRRGRNDTGGPHDQLDQ